MWAEEDSATPGAGEKAPRLMAPPAAVATRRKSRRVVFMMLSCFQMRMDGMGVYAIFLFGALVELESLSAASMPQLSSGVPISMTWL
jgi:hypothetical protein